MNQRDEELLSAYLDDEVSTEEKTFVESRLAAAAAWRRALENFRKIKAFLNDASSVPAPDHLWRP